MNGIRAKISAKVNEDGLVCIHVDWVNVVDNQIQGDPVATDDFRITEERSEGCSFLSRVVMQDAWELPGTFWIDENGLRHFYVAADAGEIRNIGIDCLLEKAGG